MGDNVQDLLDFNKEFDVRLFDRVVNSFYTGTATPEVEKVLVEFREHPQAWQRFATIVETSQSENAKVFGLSVLENCIRFRWNMVSTVDKDHLKKYIIQFISAMCKDDERKKHNLLIRKMNLILVQVLKHEWPQNWPDFIPSLVTWSGESEALCGNSLQILLLLSEEVFEYGSEEMTQQKKQAFQSQFSQEFGQIFDLLLNVLTTSENEELLSIALATFLRFMTWIPIFYVFESSVIECLAMKCFPIPNLRNRVLECLTEIASIEIVNLSKAAEYGSKLVNLYQFVVNQIVCQVITHEADIKTIYDSEDYAAQAFIRHLGNFLSQFFRHHLSLMTGFDDGVSAMQQGLDLLVRISQVDDREIFKITLDYWQKLVSELYMEMNKSNFQGMNANSQVHLGFGATTPQSNPVLMPFKQILSRLRVVMISKMEKPEEVIIVENDDGEIERETLKDTDGLAVYKSMRECLVYLTHLDPDDTQMIMLEKLSRQADGSEWSWHNLNTLCWAIGSISGALNEKQEKRFLVYVIRDLLSLCEEKSGKKHKAVIASNIMYVVGQYPRFLRCHWKFLKTVINKLFEFMHEKFPGVQEMACDTFLKIAVRCKTKFVYIQDEGDTRPFVQEILERLNSIISDLDPPQVQTFYEAMGHIIKAESNPEGRQQLCLRLMVPPNQGWVGFVQTAQENRTQLADINRVRELRTIIKTNTCLSRSLGNSYLVQFSRIFVELLQIYTEYCKLLMEHNPETYLARAMRGVKQDTLGLLESVVEHCKPIETFIDPMVSALLDDYVNAAARSSAGVLRVFSAIILNTPESILLDQGIVLRVLQQVFPVTVQMITQNFEDFPEHRVAFFTLIKAINHKCFRAFFSISDSEFKLIYDSIIWAVRHLERTVSETGLTTLLEMLGHVAESDLTNSFYQRYFTSILQDITAVLTDTMHKPGFMLHCQILKRLLGEVELQRVTVPLFDITQQQFPSNQAFVRHYFAQMLCTAFNHVTRQQVETFVQGLCQLSAQKEEKPFLLHVRDFLIQLREFQVDSEGNAELFQEEQKAAKEKELAEQQQKFDMVPGLEYQGPSTTS